MTTPDSAPTYTFTGNMLQLTGGAVLPEKPSTLSFSPNMKQPARVVYEGRVIRVRPFSVVSDENGDFSVQLLANDPGLNVTGIQWLVTIQVPGLNRGESFWMDAAADGDIIDYPTVVPVPRTEVESVTSLTVSALLALVNDDDSGLRAVLDALYGSGGANDPYEPYPARSDFPATGVADRIYHAEDTGKLYWWNGSTYLQLSDKAAVGLALVDNTPDSAKPVSGPQAAALLGLVQAAKNPDLLITGAITVDGNDLTTSAAVMWPDGSPGTLTIISRDANNAVLSYNITYGSPVTKTFTQPAITRNPNGAATNVPAIVVS